MIDANCPMRYVIEFTQSIGEDVIFNRQIHMTFASLNGAKEFVEAELWVYAKMGIPHVKGEILEQKPLTIHPEELGCDLATLREEQALSHPMFPLKLN